MPANWLRRRRHPFHERARPVLPPGILEALNPYAIETRYPGVWEPIERDEAVRAVAVVRLVRDAVRLLLPPTVLP